jgi:chromosome segregation ATPase
MEDSAKEILLRVGGLEHRVSRLESQILEVERDNKGIVASLAAIHESVSKINDSIERLRQFETDIRTIREKLLTYDQKFEIIVDLKKLMLGTLCAVVPGAIAMIMELSLRVLGK